VSLPAEQDESTAFSESLRGGRAHLLAISKTGSGAYPRAHADKTAVTREDFSSPLGAFLTQIPKPDSKKFYKRVPPELVVNLFPWCVLNLFLWLNDYRESADWRAPNSSLSLAGRGYCRSTG